MSFDSGPVFGWTIFCDDIRAELGGKFSFMGCYTGNLIVHDKLPLMLPKLGIAITYYERIRGVTDPVKIRVYFPWEKEPVITGDLPVDKFRATLADPDARYHRIDLTFVAAPFHIPSLGIVRTEVVVGDTAFDWGRLKIQQQLRDEEAPPLTSQPTA
ncbi:hypothetical protein [Methyloceanibacter sp.]|uniref:hypothetical protein n=1 Tax=Methyloceanibacter sp. TaxID=1965321 RepID=UPI003D6D2247